MHPRRAVAARSSWTAPVAPRTRRASKRQQCHSACPRRRTCGGGGDLHPAWGNPVPKATLAMFVTTWL
eukprot:363244-Chlamydomonas_euryale.AAC.9